jgi:hypothetical protein
MMRCGVVDPRPWTRKTWASAAESNRADRPSDDRPLCCSTHKSLGSGQLFLGAAEDPISDRVADTK